MPNSRKRGGTYGAAPTDAHREFFWFETNGAADPVAFSPTITAVERLITAGATPFYRVTARPPNHYGRPDAVYEQTASIATQEGDDLRAEIMTGLEADPGAVAALSATQFDVVLRVAGVPSTAVVAGRRVYVAMTFDVSKVF